jgi:hypothetical protein
VQSIRQGGTVTFEILEARYEVKEVLKGTPPTSGVVKDLPFGPGNCSLPLHLGLEFVFMPDEFDMEQISTGSFGYFNPEGTAILPRLASIRALVAATK